MALTLAQIAKAAVNAQVAYCLDKHPTYDAALAEEIEALVAAPLLARIAALTAQVEQSEKVAYCHTRDAQEPTLKDAQVEQAAHPSEVEKLMDAAGLCRRCAAPKDSAVTVTPGGDVVLTSSDVASRVCRSVAELPDRNSPDGWPEAMLVTQDELREIVMGAITDWVDCTATNNQKGC